MTDDDAMDNIIKLAEYQARDNAAILTEDRVALAFAEQYKGQLLFDHDAGTWFRWSGSHWQRERTKIAFQWSRELARELSETNGKKRRTSLGKTGFASGVERFAQVDRTFAITSDDWNHNPFLLATPGGTVDLRTGIMRVADPADRINQLTVVTPAVTEDCPRWLKFLSETTGNDVTFMHFLWRWLGYCLTGDTREHALLFCFGSGMNGKSVFLNTVAGILGDYATVSSMTAFTASKNERHPADLAMLRGARLVVASETEEGHRWAEARIKQLTGGDRITARFMHQNFFTYLPTFKITITGNHKPNLSNVDDAAKRRFNMAPFLCKPSSPDRQLFDKLHAEWPGILRWMISGCLDWQRNGLVPAPAIIEATKDYFDNQDLFSQWLEDECDVEPGNRDKWDTSAELFKSWSGYAKTAGETPGGRKGFANLLEKRGFRKDREDTKSRTRIWRGLRLKIPPND
jgi:putative DNA primase/helicase